MVVVLVKWYIKKEAEDQFKKHWVNMHPATNDGLFREFFSKPIDETTPKYHSLDVENKHYLTFINVGIWKSVEDFELAIGKMIPPREKHPSKEGKELIEVFDFEFKLRERIVMNVETTREGGWDLK